jgi:hypothetical protein
MVKGELRTLRITLEATDSGILGYVYLRDIPEGAVARTVALDREPSVHADYDAEGALLGLEFLDAQAADAEVMRRLAKRLSVPELAGIDLAEMCGAAAR